MDTPIGGVPAPGALDTDGLDISAEDLHALLSVDPEDWKKELPSIREHYAIFGDRLPQALRDQLSALEQRLDTAS